jgi:hypothetical protein
MHTRFDRLFCFYDNRATRTLFGSRDQAGRNATVKFDEIPAIFDLVIVDEAHHYPADTWRLLIDHFSNAPKLFLTATPICANRQHIQTILQSCGQQCVLISELQRADFIRDHTIRSHEFHIVDEEPVIAIPPAARIVDPLTPEMVKFHSICLLSPYVRCFTSLFDFLAMFVVSARCCAHYH